MFHVGLGFRVGFAGAQHSKLMSGDVASNPHQSGKKQNKDSSLVLEDFQVFALHGEPKISEAKFPNNYLVPTGRLRKIADCQIGVHPLSRSIPLSAACRGVRGKSKLCWGRLPHSRQAQPRETRLEQVAPSENSLRLLGNICGCCCPQGRHCLMARLPLPFAAMT